MNARCARAATARAPNLAHADPMRRVRAAVVAILLASWSVSQVAPGASAWAVAGEVVYEARDALATGSGRAPLDEVELQLDPDDLGTLRVVARVLPATFDSGNLLRDRRARATVFEVDEHPVATLAGSATAQARGQRIAPGETRGVDLIAELTLHGVTLPYPIVVTLARPPLGVAAPWRAEAEFVVSLTAHGMRRPSLLGLVTDDEVRLRVQATGHPDPTPTPTTR